MNFSIQPVLENDKVLLLPLKEADFEELYLCASDEKIWVQHPNKDRWKKEVFQTFFEGAIKSNGSFKIDKVYLHVGATNFRSQTAITRLGANKIAEEEIAYYSEPVKLNFVYEISRDSWLIT